MTFDVTCVQIIQIDVRRIRTEGMLTCKEESEKSICYIGKLEIKEHNI